MRILNDTKLHILTLNKKNDFQFLIQIKGIRTLYKKNDFQFLIQIKGIRTLYIKNNSLI